MTETKKFPQWAIDKAKGKRKAMTKDEKRASKQKFRDAAALLLAGK